MIGLTTAIALAQSGLPVWVLDRQPMDEQVLPAFDGRVSALTHTSRILMENIGVWPFMKAYAQPILNIAVVDQGSPVTVHYDHRDIGPEPMGHIIENRHIRQALQQRLAELNNITVLAPADWSDVRQESDGALLTLEDGREIATELLIAADGKRSPIRQKMAIPVICSEYRQTAIVATIAHERAHQGLALERFFPAGPFAVLPMLGNRSSLVWVEAAEDAALYARLEPPSVEVQIQKRVGEYLGKITLEGPLFTYPLDVLLARNYYKGRVALVGDAAHGIHPIAGQGLNLGFRDAAALAEILLDAARLGQNLGIATVLDQYQRWRRFDAMTMTSVTDGLNRLFSNENKILKMMRNIGFAGVEKLPPLKHFFMRHAMGMVGDLPKLMQKSQSDRLAA